MVGGYAFRYALDNPAVERVAAIGRRKLGISHPKLDEVVHRDFADCSALAETLSLQDAAIFCVGTYTGSVSDSEFCKVTVDYTVEFARVLHGSRPGAAFSFLSGADQAGRSRMSFARYKGRGREYTSRGGVPEVVHISTCVYLPRRAAQGNFSYRLLRAIYSVFRLLSPNQVIPADQLGKAMVDVAVQENWKRAKLVLQNRDIRVQAERRLS
jgi:hypothetical protein